MWKLNEMKHNWSIRPVLNMHNG